MLVSHSYYPVTLRSAIAFVVCTLLGTLAPSFLWLYGFVCATMGEISYSVVRVLVVRCLLRCCVLLVVRYVPSIPRLYTVSRVVDESQIRVLSYYSHINLMYEDARPRLSAMLSIFCCIFCERLLVYIPPGSIPHYLRYSL
jgi:hypothetical protein